MTKMLFDIPRPEEPPKNPTPEIAPKTYRHSIVDSVKTPIETLTAYLGGSNWQVDFYAQVRGSSEELKAFDPNSLNPYQTYHKISKLIIKLQGALSQDDETNTGRFEMAGTAVIPPHPGLVPNVGDAFIADVGEGSAGQFSIISIRKLSNNLASAWSIEFKMERIVTEKIVRLIDSKVVKTSYYNRDYLITGQNPILVEEDFNASRTLTEHFNHIANQLVSQNFSFDTHTVTVPGQTRATYDPFVVRAILRIISNNEVKLYRDIREYNCDDHRIPKFDDLYTAVIRRDPTLLYNTFTQYARLSVNLLNPSIYQNSIRYSGIYFVVVPYRSTLDNDNYSALNDIISGQRLSSVANGLETNSLTALNYTELATTRPGFDIPSITSDSYVLTPAFYSNELVKCTKFERCIWNVLNNDTIAYQDVYPFCQEFKNWSKMEQYYLGPLLLLLIRHTLRGL